MIIQWGTVTSIGASSYVDVNLSVSYSSTSSYNLYVTQRLLYTTDTMGRYAITGGVPIGAAKIRVATRGISGDACYLYWLTIGY